MHAMSAEKQSTKAGRRPKEEVYARIDEAHAEPATAMRALRSELPWRDWLVTDFLRYWYLVGVLALLVFVTLGIAQMYHVRDLLGDAALGVMAVVTLVLGYIGYRVLWPQGGLTRIETLRRALRRMRRRRGRFQ